MCGLCSQHCPTYELSQLENESPRGRIALINAANQGQLTLDAKAREHLQHCIGCRACEHFCPSGVQFGEIMDRGRVLLEQTRDTQGPAETLQKALLGVVARPRRLTAVTKCLRRYQRWGLQKLLRTTGLLRLLGLAKSEQLLPAIQLQQTAHGDYSPAKGTQRGDVALFTGCISSMVEGEALDATRRLLNQLGYGVYTPSTQTCCGALHRHSGRPDSADLLALDNLRAFMSLQVEAIVHTASGCAAQLAEYGLHLQHGEHATQAENFSRKIQDISRFLADIIARGDWPQELRLRPLPQTVVLHTPCSLRNVLRTESAPLQVLQMIPGIDLQALPHSLGCCGAGGGYMLTQADFSRRMRQKTLHAVGSAARHNTLLATSNIGCAMNLAAGLREQGQNIEVLHPVTLLYRQLATADV